MIAANPRQVEQYRAGKRTVAGFFVGQVMKASRIIVMLAHNLRLKVTAEGVETQAQLDLLRRMDCEQAQGYLFSKPADPQTIEKLLAAKRAGIARATRTKATAAST